MFGMLDYRAHKLYLLLFGIPIIVIQLAACFGLPFVNYALGHEFADDRLWQILISIGLTFVVGIVWAIFIFGFVNKLFEFVFGLFVDVIPTDGRNKEQAKAVVHGGEKAIIRLKIANLDAKEWTDEDILSFVKLDWVASWFFHDEISKRLETVREHFIEHPSLEVNDWTINKAIKDNGMEMTFFEKTLTNVIWRREIVSYVFFAYLLWTNPFA